MKPTADPLRPDLFVVARILERLLREGEPMLRTHLQVASNLNYGNCVRYVEWLRQRALVEVVAGDGEAERVALTRKGREAYAQLSYWISEFIESGRRG